MTDHLRVQFLGTGTISPHPQRSCSSTLMESPHHRILVDIGAGTLRRLAEARLGFLDIDYIFLTHFHPDHIADLIPFVFGYINAVEEKNHTLNIWGPQGFGSFIAGQKKAYGKWFEYCLERVGFHELKHSTHDFNGFRLIWRPVAHTEASVGYRFNFGGCTVSFSGDSGYCQELIDLCENADLAVIECAHADEYAVKGHLSPSLVGQIATKGAAKSIALNHFYPDALETDILSVVQKYYNGPVKLLSDGDEIQLSL